MTDTIVVIGATGNVGRALVDHLGAAGIVPRVLTRQASATWRVPVERIVGDASDPACVARLMTGATRAFVMSHVDANDAIDRGVVAAAVAAGVRQLVKLSTIGVESDSEIGRRHRAREQLIEQSGLAWTFVRPGFFMSNALQWREAIRTTGEVQLPAADGPIVPISPRDIAEVAKLALLDQTAPPFGGTAARGQAPVVDGAAHAGKAYALTGELAITAREQLAVLSRVLGRELVCVPVAPDVAAANARKRGLPEAVVETLRKLWVSTEAGQAATRTSTFRELTGHAPESFESWARDHADAFR
jgi:uncharacterized protein YbjT (DUF2867 family)